MSEKTETTHAPECPYCGEEPLDYWEDRHVRDEHGMEFDDREYDCPSCERPYLVSQRVTYHMTATPMTEGDQ